ncbi:hypothetical protein NUSPORA_01709 [Nucleospora cyclopteri]
MASFNVSNDIIGYCHKIKIKMFWIFKERLISISRIYGDKNFKKRVLIADFNNLSFVHKRLKRLKDSIIKKIEKDYLRIKISFL